VYSSEASRAQHSSRDRKSSQASFFSSISYTVPFRITARMLLNLVAPALALLSTVSASAVLDLTPKNFDKEILKSGKPALVEFFAPWCGHCKNLAPVYEELATNFQHAADKVVVAKVDADNHKDLGKKYGVQGFPTLKWFDGKSNKPIEYDSGRDLESLSKWITDKTGIRPKVKGKLPSKVVMLDDKSFGETIGKEQDVLVAFTAPWCGRKLLLLDTRCLSMSNLLKQTARTSLLSGKPSPTTSQPSPASSSPKSMPKLRIPRRLPKPRA
jgi:protein disulfide-isomerase-like protein